MIKVLEIFPSTTDTMLVCEKFDTNDVTETMETNIGIFNKGEFAICEMTHCFGEPKTSSVVILGKKDCRMIRTINFI